MISYRYLVAMTLFLAAVLVSVHAEPQQRTLTGPPSHYLSTQGEDFRLVPAHPRDGAGRPITRLPATRIELKDEEGEWEQVRDADIPPFALPLADEVRPQLQLFYASATGWMVVPRGWKPRRTAVGVDGNTIFSFVAPDGAAAGWMSWTLYPACLGCIYEAAQGLFPGAHKALDELMETRTPEPSLEPRPDTLERLDRCTVRLAYRLPASPPVRAMAVFDQTGDPFYRELAVGVPESRSALAASLLASFQSAHGGCGKP
ncbi:DUF4850 domain-containing protein [Dyella sp. BiH032]|uniref:DUF4850 domain-containing protein n=1 Tax=Dyella sp. BiH032 TaxID=3075430 RepID=UPI00289323B4|nr:DUF4850 domain-containing protein [Dyella sp. BiH032]WNL46608.1 DUF4850 domain-containing protein [Dyella sp. BiH032]